MKLDVTDTPSCHHLNIFILNIFTLFLASRTCLLCFFVGGNIWSNAKHQEWKAGKFKHG